MAPSTLSITLWLHLRISEFTCNMLRFFYIIQKVYLRTYRVESERAKKREKKIVSQCDIEFSSRQSTISLNLKPRFGELLMSTLTYVLRLGKHWIGPSTIAFRKRDENGSHTAIRPYTASIASALPFTSMQQMHNDLCPPPHHLTTPFSHVTLLLLRPTMAYRGRNFSPSIFAVFRRISRYITPAECIQNAVRPCKYPISILSPFYLRHLN